MHDGRSCFQATFMILSFVVVPMRCPREQFLQDIEAVFQKAFETGNYQAALKAKEVLGREQGILGSQKRNLA